MEYYINLDAGGFSAAELADIKLCLETLLSVRAGSQPLDRNFGIDLDRIAGYPLNVAQNILSLEIMEKVEAYEPRVEVESVDFETRSDGQLVPHIHFVKADIEIEEEEE